MAFGSLVDCLPGIYVKLNTDLNVQLKFLKTFELGALKIITISRPNETHNCCEQSNEK